MKYMPRRMCVGCREMKNKKELIRVVRKPEGGLDVDTVGKMPGRGAYLCPDEGCLKKTRKNRGLERALNMNLSEEVWGKINNRLKTLASKGDASE